ncbi:MAG TPA: hypothetical protein VGB07_18695 [Blastocatellia bacterium]
MRLNPSQSLGASRIAARIGAVIFLGLTSLAPASAFFRQHPPETFAESRIASAVIAARNDGERRALVTAQPQLINLRFRHALAMQVLRLQMKGDHQRVLATLGFARQLAEERKDKGWVAMTLIDNVGTYNLSGNALKALAEFRKVPPPEDLAHDRQALARSTCAKTI